MLLRTPLVKETQSADGVRGFTSTTPSLNNPTRENLLQHIREKVAAPVLKQEVMNTARAILVLNGENPGTIYDPQLVKRAAADLLIQCGFTVEE